MSWEWRAWMPLEKESMGYVPGGADVAPYMGTGIEVADLTEVHFLIHPAVELRAVRRAAPAAKEPTTFTLRVCAERSVRTNVDCWVMQPKLRVPLPEGTEDEAADGALLELPAVRHWLRRHAERCTHSDTASPVLDQLASGQLRPTTMRMSRRQLRAATPNVAGVILEQSDLMAGGRMWRCVSAHGTSADAVYRYSRGMRDRLPSQVFIQSAPSFVRMLEATRAAHSVQAAAGPQQPADAAPLGSGRKEPGAEPEAPEGFIYAVDATGAPLCRNGSGEQRRRADIKRTAELERTANSANLSGREHLEEMWAASGDGFGRRIALAARDADAAQPKPDAPPKVAAVSFPDALMRRALGEAARDGDVALVAKLCLLPGTRPAAPCGLPPHPLRAPLHHAASAGSSECVRLLCLARADVSATADGGSTALHVAARGGSVAHSDVARVLLAYGGSASATDLRGATPLGVARAAGGVEITEVLYAAAHNGLDVRGHVEVGVPAAAPWRPVGP